MSKYDALKEYLEGVRPVTRQITLRFVEIESILGFSLPHSAYTYQAWWDNESEKSNHSHAKSWLDAGFEVTAVNQNSSPKAVTFSRA